MQTVLIVFHLMIVVALVATVLLQRSEGGALGMGGGGGFMTGRGQANALTRATSILAALFFVTSLGLSILASHSRPRGSILDTAAPQGQAAPSEPAGNNLLDKLKNLENQSNGSAAPAPAPAPAAPAGPEVPKSQ